MNHAGLIVIQYSASWLGLIVVTVVVAVVFVFVIICRRQREEEEDDDEGRSNAIIHHPASSYNTKYNKTIRNLVQIIKRWCCCY